MEMVRDGRDVAAAHHPALRRDDGDVHAGSRRIGKPTEHAE
jgi:hypothetical protein